jgi:hypothetical protein
LSFYKPKVTTSENIWKDKNEQKNFKHSPYLGTHSNNINLNKMEMLEHSVTLCLVYQSLTNHWKKNACFNIKKCVAYPQEDFLFIKLIKKLE